MFPYLLDAVAERRSDCANCQDEVIHACQFFMINPHLNLTSRNEEQKFVELFFTCQSWFDEG